MMRRIAPAGYVTLKKMKQMIRNLFFGLLMITTLAVGAQQPGVHPSDSGFIARYAGYDFKGRFASAIEKDAENNYFLLDFSKLPTRFDRVYFMNMSFSYAKIINADPDIKKDRVCFMSKKMYNETDVLNIFEEIKEKVAIISASWPEDWKSEWLNTNDKYK